MKGRFTALVISFFLLGNSLFAQTFTGVSAGRLVQGSELVRMEEGSFVPSFVRLNESAIFPADKLGSWAKKAFNLGDDIKFSLVREETDKLGIHHHRYQITSNGSVVYGAFLYTHGIGHTISSINGRIPASVLQKQASLSEENALESAKNHIGAESYKWELEEEESHLKWETENPNATYFPTGELVYIDPSFKFNKSDAFRLAYKFDIYAHQPVYRAEVFVDASTGEVLFENHRIHIADAVGTAQTGYSGTKTITADSFGGGFRLREAGRGNGVRTFDMNEGTNYGNSVDFTDANNVWNNANANLDQYATDAHWGAEMTYDYYLNEHGRNGIDDNNMQINSYVHYDQDYFNAFWDGQRMTYGDGNGNPLTALDICGHEMTHGVTEFTAGLIYQDEYGALNESFSDIFGAAVEFVANPSSGDWLMGEDVGTLRSMSNPNAYGDPDTYDGTNWATGAGDNGGVHTNSGVQNKWFYILVEGESGTNDNGDVYNVTGIGLDDASAIAYRNLSVYLGQTSEYADARFYSIQAAIDLFGGCSPEVIACTNAWYAVGVGDPFDATVVSDFTAGITVSCEAPFTVDFENQSANGSTFSWDFGDGGTSTDLNPSHTYTNTGNYTITLFVDGDNCGTDTETVVDFVSIDPNNPCTALMPEDGSQTLSWCTGTLYDDGGPNGNYQDNNEVITTISPPSATSVTLTFTSFGYEESYDYLYIYDGPNTNSPLIGQYDGFNLPNGGTISSTGGSITIRQTSDIYVNESGFALTWECVQPNSPPTPNFYGSPRVTCDGQVSFSDLSINNATSWLWDFGDGNTSTDQNPTHTYQNEGTYTVILTATNQFGSDVVSQTNYITVDRPDGPAASGDFRCDAGSLSLSASGNGTLQWYDQASGGSSIGSGSSFNTPSINTTTTYYVEDAVLPTSYGVGPANNTFGGGGNFTGDQYLIFDALTAFTLQTVKVYAQGGGDRTIELRDNTGNVLQTTTVNIPNGEQTVTLNFNVQPGTDYQLGTTPGPDLYRNNDSPNYPYTTAGVASITNSSAGTDYYYFFYDWQVETPGCISDRTAVVAEISTSPSTQGGSRCGTGSVALSASGSGNLNWFDAATGGSQVNSGTSFNTPSISNTTSYFVETEILPAAQYGGAPDNNFGTGSEFNNIQSLLFDCYQQVTLVSVKVYAFGAGNRTVELRNAGGTVLQSATINIPDGESRIDLNFDLPIGTDLQLGTAAAPALYRNNSGPSYPYDMPGVLSITSSTAGNDYYYFFYDWEVQRDGCTTARTEVIATIEPTPTVSVSGNNTVCEGQSVAISSSATDADSYLWSPGGETTANISVSPTTQITYSVTVTNACGDATDQITVDVTPLPTISVSGDQEICEGETVQLTSSSSDGVEWQPGGETSDNINVSPTGTITYTASTTNNCGTASEDVTVSVNQNPTADAGQDQAICIGESVTLTASGGNGYVWSSGQATASIIVSPGITLPYEVTVTDANGCSDTDEVLVEVNEPPTVSAGVDVEICEGESVTLTASGASTYNWDTQESAESITVSPSQTSTYSVTGIDGNNCSATDEVTVSVNELPSQPIISANGSDLQTSGGTSYQWYLDGVLIENATSAIYTPIQTGNYTVVLFDENGCSSTSEEYSWIAVGIAEIEGQINVYPNPFSDQLIVVSNSKISSLNVVDIQGRLVLEIAPTNTKTSISTESWANGVYFIQMQAEDNQFFKKILKAE